LQTFENSMTKHKARQAKRAIADSASGLQDLIDSAEDLLESVRDQPGEVADQLRSKVSSTLKSARARLDKVDVQEMASDTFDSTVGFLRSDPWRTVAIGALAVLAVSLLVNRGSD
jgi:ElaB/YqjD/DUF883 family membrane-anchored ribosome-binding protein